MNNEKRHLVERIFQDAQFVQSLGIELNSWGEGWCETRVKVLPAHRQQHGFIHAGVLMTLADHTCGGAAASTMAEGRDGSPSKPRFRSCARPQVPTSSAAPWFYGRERVWSSQNLRSWPMAKEAE
jgi:acyl-coenzyme A thioesterase PaaI-like protein